MASDLDKYLTEANKALGQINFLIPLGTTAIKQLYDLLKKSEPELTPAQYIARLANTAGEVKGEAAEWLRSKGYTQDPTGNWIAPQ